MIFTSPHPNVTDPKQSVYQYVLGDITGFSEKTAIINSTNDERISYAELKTLVEKLAFGLQEKGLKKGDVIAIYSPNVPEYVMLFLAVAKLGAICTTANPLYTANELSKQLQDSNAKFLVTVPSFLEKAKEAANSSNVEEIFVIGSNDLETPFDNLLTQEGKVVEPALDYENDVCVLPYSSGTTGLPKGVMLTHKNLVINMCQTRGMSSFNSIDQDDTVLGVLPFFHIYGMVVIMLYTLSRGATLLVMPKFDMENFLSSVAKYKVTKAPLVPPIILGLAKHPLVDSFDLSSLKLIMSGAAPLAESTAKEAADRVGCQIAQGYGMTEASPVTHLMPTNLGGHKVGSLGLPIPNTEVIIVDPETGNRLGKNQNGEIWIRGPQIMKGYLNRPDATRESIDQEGWYHTGDIGYADEEGFFFAVDRMKELIKYKGMQVAPAELEALLLTHPSVVDAAVIPVQDEEAGELPKGFIVLRDGQVESAESIMQFVAERVAPHKKIRIVEFVNQIPKSASGKILRRLLIEQERSKA